MCDLPVQWLTLFRTFRPMDSLPRLEVISVERRREAGYRFEGRLRREETHCLFEYTLEGEGRFRDAAGTYRVGPGRGFLCRVGDPATAYYYPPEASAAWTFVYVTFRGGPSDAVVDEMVDRYGPLFDLPLDGEMLRRLLGYSAMDGRDVPISAAEGGRFVMDLLTELAARREPAPESDTAGLLVRRAMDLVGRHIGSDINAGQLADRLGVSREHLARIFRRQTSRSPYQYIVRRKMLHACRLLKGSEMGVKQIAASVGYADTAHFARSFKAVIGQTPTRFRAAGIMPGDL